MHYVTKPKALQVSVHSIPSKSNIATARPTLAARGKDSYTCHEFRRERRKTTIYMYIWEKLWPDKMLWYLWIRAASSIPAEYGSSDAKKNSHVRPFVSLTTIAVDGIGPSPCWIMRDPNLIDKRFVLFE